MFVKFRNEKKVFNFCMLLCTSRFAVWRRVWLLWCRVASSSSSQPLLCNIRINSCVWATTVAVAVVLLEQLSCLIKVLRVHLCYSLTQLANLSSHHNASKYTASSVQEHAENVVREPLSCTNHCVQPHNVLLLFCSDRSVDFRISSTSGCCLRRVHRSGK